MCMALDRGELDVAVVLTEGAIKFVSQGLKAKIISQWVVSPLVWGIHTFPGSGVGGHSYLEHTLAISRPGSGSHLMPMVDALFRNLDPNLLKWYIAGSLEGAVDAFAARLASVFYWEKYTTMPFVEDGTMLRIAEIATPWPCFVVLASEQVWMNRRDTVKSLVSHALSQAHTLQNDPTGTEMFAQEYGLGTQIVEEWLPSVHWASDLKLDVSALQYCSNILTQVGELPHGSSVANLIDL